jgi:hypothetical protein
MQKNHTIFIRKSGSYKFLFTGIKPVDIGKTGLKKEANLGSERAKNAAKKSGK